jgi:hypothetical protein
MSKALDTLLIKFNRLRQGARHLSEASDLTNKEHDDLIYC